MCSCNDCSKNGKQIEKRGNVCLHLNLLKEIKALKAFFWMSLLSHSMTLLQLLWDDSVTVSEFTDPGNIKLSWHQEASDITAFKFTDGELSQRDAFGCVEQKDPHNKAWCLKELAACKTWEKPLQATLGFCSLCNALTDFDILERESLNECEMEHFICFSTQSTQSSDKCFPFIK